mmetsp:Transcript_12471/g.15129  ORF Transcript_12471/g.15129 Transcript_12471/m.15129 type:complete len:119 (+) Transcript_12471:476-832(+)
MRNPSTFRKRISVSSLGKKSNGMSSMNGKGIHAASSVQSVSSTIIFGVKNVRAVFIALPVSKDVLVQNTRRISCSQKINLQRFKHFCFLVSCSWIQTPSERVAECPGSLSRFIQTHSQ